MEPDPPPSPPPPPPGPPRLQHHHHPHPTPTQPGHTLLVVGVPGTTPVHYDHAVPPCCTPLEGHVGVVPAEQWRWCGSGGRGTGGAHCSVTCGHDGLVLTYNTHPGAACAARCACCAAPAPVCPVLSPTPAHPPTHAAAPDVPGLSRSLGDLSVPQDCGAAGRSMTFSGSLDRNTPRPAQRPYGRRCKSTAHIVLQNNHAHTEAQRPHEFHSTSGPHLHVPPPEARGRARHRAAPPPPGLHGGGEGGGHGGGVAGTCRWCPCPPWTTLQCGLASGVNHDPCHPCLHPLQYPCTHHTPHTHHTSHTHHTPTFLAPCCGPYAPAAPCPAAHPGSARPASRSPTQRTFDSHRCYEEQCGAPRRGSGPGGQRRAGSPPPSPRLTVRRHPLASPRGSASPERRGAAGEDAPPQGTPKGTPQLPRRVPRMGAAAAAAAAAATASSSSSAPPTQEERERGASRHRPQRPRPRTIHIDVYCSSSDDQVSSAASSPSSEDTPHSGSRRPHAVVALGSKRQPKTEVTLGHQHHHQRHTLEQRTSSFVYSRPVQPHAAHAAPRSTFMTDDDLPLCTSPTEPRHTPSASASSPTTQEHGRRPSHHHCSPIPMPAPPQRPTTLAVPPCTVLPPDQAQGEAPHSHHSSLSYLSSPLEGDTWEGDLWEAEPDFSWRGSEFETSTPRLTSDMDLAVAGLTSEVSLTSLQEGGSDGSPRMWRSPQLERQRYMQRDHEDRYREVLKRRTQQQLQQQQQKQQAERQRSLSDTPTRVSQLEQLSAFKNFSKEDLKVISKSLERRESQQSLRQEDPVILPQHRESFRPVVQKDTNRLLEWMQQYKEQEGRASAQAGQQGFRSLAKDESAWPGTHLVVPAVARKESYCSVGRRRSFPGNSGGWVSGPVGNVRRGDSLRNFGVSEDVPRRGTHRLAPTPTRPLEKRNSIKFQDKQQYFRSLERRESGTHTTASLERRGSGRVERRGSGRVSGWCGSRGPQGTPAARDQVKSTASLVCGDAAASPTVAPKSGEVEAQGHQPSSGQLDQQSHTSPSAAWQEGMSTVRRRLSTSTHQAREGGRSPCKAPSAGPDSASQGTSQSPLPQRRRVPASPPGTEEVGGGTSTPGVFHRLARFPFSHTMPAAATRMLQAHRTACIPEERQYVRPQLFGEMTSSYPSGRGIHYGPPRNPQCSCRTCRAWTDQAAHHAPAGRLRAWSLSDLDNGVTEHPATPPHRPDTTLSRTSSSVNDHSVHPHVGSAAAGREQS